MDGQVCRFREDTGLKLWQYFRVPAGLRHGFLLSGGEYSTIAVPHAPSQTWAFGINNTGRIVGTYVVGAGLDARFHGFLLSDGEYSVIDPPDSTGTALYGINDAGQMIGFYRDANQASHGLVLSDGEYSTLDVPGSTLTAAYGINNAGQIVGTYRDAAGYHGFIATSK
jgi:uncharacterized membrane protein